MEGTEEGTEGDHRAGKVVLLVGACLEGEHRGTGEVETLEEACCNRIFQQLLGSNGKSTYPGGIPGIPGIGKGGGPGKGGMAPGTKGGAPGTGGMIGGGREAGTGGTA